MMTTLGQPLDQGTSVGKQESEIERENERLRRLLSANLDAVQKLTVRLNPILRQIPTGPQLDKKPEVESSPTSPLGNWLREHRAQAEELYMSINSISEMLAL